MYTGLGDFTTTTATVILIIILLSQNFWWIINVGFHKDREKIYCWTADTGNNVLDERPSQDYSTSRIPGKPYVLVWIEHVCRALAHIVGSNKSWDDLRIGPYQYKQWWEGDAHICQDAAEDPICHWIDGNSQLSRNVSREGTASCCQIMESLVTTTPQRHQALSLLTFHIRVDIKFLAGIVDSILKSSVHGTIFTIKNVNIISLIGLQRQRMKNTKPYLGWEE
jgi:hypothetical protein